MAAGRPTKYSEAIQKRADEYVDGGYEAAGDLVPSLHGLADTLRVGSTTLQRWAEAHEAFRVTLDRQKDKQARLLVSGGLGSTMNSTIVKLMMSNHGYRESSQTDHTSSDGSMRPTVVEFVRPSDVNK